MKLRDHPGMVYRGIPNWPPVWVQPRKNEPPKTVRGEKGTLVYVYANEAVSTKCYLVSEYERERYIGALLFSDRAMCVHVTRLLRTQTGRSIKEIGDLDLSETL